MEGMIPVLKSHIHSNNWHNFINGLRKFKEYKPKINTSANLMAEHWKVG